MNAMLSDWFRLAEGLWAPWIEVAVKSTLLLGLALGLHLLLRRRPLACSAMWNAALVGLLLLPIGVAVGPRLAVWTVPQAEVTPPLSMTGDALNGTEWPESAFAADGALAEIQSDYAQPSQALASQGSGAAAVESLLAMRPTQATPLPMRGFVVLLIGLGTLFGMLRLVQALGAVRRLRWEATPVTAQSWNAALSRWADRLGLRRPVELKQSPQVSVPIVVGAIHPVILLPQELAEESDKQHIDAILSHELAHVRRGDYGWQLLLRFLQCVFWYQPLLWLAERLLAANRERVCDEFAVHAVGDSDSYVATLLAMAERLVRRPSVSLGMAMVRAPRLAGRLDAIRQSRGDVRCAPGRAATCVTATVSAILVGILAAATVVEGQEATTDAVTGPPVETPQIQAEATEQNEASSPAPKDQPAPTLAYSKTYSNRGSAEFVVVDNNAVVALSSKEGAFDIYDIDDGSILLRIGMGEFILGRLRLSSDRQWLAREEYAPGSTSALVVVSRNMGHETRASVQDCQGLLDLSRGGEVVAVVRDNRIELWNGVSSERIKSAPFEHTRIDAARFSPDGSLLAISDNGSLILWHWRQDEHERIQLEGPLGSLAFSPDGRLLAKGPIAGKQIQILNVESKQVVQSLSNGEDLSMDVPQLAFTQGGRVLIACDKFQDDNSQAAPQLRMWDLADGSLVHQLDVPAEIPQSFDVSPNELYIVMLARDENNIKLIGWRLDGESPAEERNYRPAVPRSSFPNRNP